MRVLVACEFSGTVRDAFAKRGHDAWSCDLDSSETEGNHIQGNVLDVLHDSWDLVIAHPPCTYLCNSGVCWLDSDPKRWKLMYDGAMFFREFMKLPRYAIENPIPHKYALGYIGRKYDQTIQPWQFGHGETKRTCLWLNGVPALKPTNVVDGREQRIHRMSPGPNRQKERSRFFAGIAEAMAEQWGGVA